MLYVYQCPRCGPFERVRKHTEKNLMTSTCPACKRRGCGRDLKVSSPRVIPDAPGYYSEAMGVTPGQKGLPGEHYDAGGRLYVEGNAHRNRLMKRLNLRDRRKFG